MQSVGRTGCLTVRSPRLHLFIEISETFCFPFPASKTGTMPVLPSPFRRPFLQPRDVLVGGAGVARAGDANWAQCRALHPFVIFDVSIPRERPNGGRT